MVHLHYHLIPKLIIVHLITNISNSFVLNTPSPSFSSKIQEYSSHYAKTSSKLSSTSLDIEKQDNNDLDIILFGIGDLRIKDHVGIFNALQGKNTVLPLIILDSKDTLPNIPGVHTHTINTSIMLSSAILGLQKDLKDKLNLELCIYSGDTVQKCLLNVLDEVNSNSFKNVNVHVCDLGDADVSMNYHPYSHLKDFQNVNIKPWKCTMRSKPWDDTDFKDFPTNYPDYYNSYCDSTPVLPYPIPENVAKEESVSTLLRSSPSHIHATQVTILSLLLSSINYLQKGEYCKNKLEQNTGLYGTHWGGVNQATCTEEDTWECINSYIKANDIDEYLNSNSISQKFNRNIKSLEHASLSWMMNQDKLTSKNLINGELMTRYLAAPLFFGCISCRQLWHAASEMESSNWFSSEKINPLQEIAEYREWHVLLAQHYLRNDASYSSSNDKIQYKYWRYHGFLARYATTKQESDKSLILVHGFGASSSQWKKMIDNLNLELPVLAPDLLGFGQSEKPNLTYTQYLWEGFVREFIKEKTDGDFYIAGNSIGGYTSMGVAADDCEGGEDFLCTGTGAPGTDRCNGVILLNSAGRLYSKDEIIALENDQKVNGATTIAQATISDSLGLCSPPPKAVATFGGKALLWYLRPRIQSICTNLYPSNPAAVDDTLCSNILRDSLDPGALNVMISGSKLPPPRTANELLNADFGNYASPSQTTFSGPVLICQGMIDPLNDATGRAYMFQSLREGIDLTPLDDGGHCPHDEQPLEVANAISNWIDSLVDGPNSLKVLDKEFS